MDGDELVAIHTFTDPNFAEIVKSAIRAEGITCELGGEGQAGFTGVFAIELLVRAADADRARKIIESHDSK